MQDKTPPLSTNGQPSVSDLERRIVKLSKINSALMQRVERSMDQQANAFSLFQTAIGLENQVKLRTDELKAALAKLEITNAELSEARDAADRTVAGVCGDDVRLAGKLVGGRASGRMRRRPLSAAISATALTSTFSASAE